MGLVPRRAESNLEVIDTQGHAGLLKVPTAFTFFVTNISTQQQFPSVLISARISFIQIKVRKKS